MNTLNRIFFFLFTDDKEAYNGAVEAATTLTGALVVFLIGFVNVDWKVWGNLAIVLMTGFTSILLYIMGITHNIWMAYSGITLFLPRMNSSTNGRPNSTRILFSMNSLEN